LIVLIVALTASSPVSGQVEQGGWPTGLLIPPSAPYGIATNEINEDLRHFYVSVKGMIIRYINYDYDCNFTSSTSVDMGIVHGVAVDGVLGYLYAADTINNRIIQWNINTTEVSGIWNNIVSAPYGIAVDSKSNVIVSDTNNHRLLKLSIKGQILQQYSTTNPSLSFPSGIDVNVEDGSDDIWVVDTGNLRVIRFQSNSSKVLNIISPIRPPSPFSWISPVGLEVTETNWLFLVDSGSGLIMGFEAATTQPTLQEYFSSISTTQNYSQPTGIAGSPMSMAITDPIQSLVAIYLYCADGSLAPAEMKVTATA